MNKITNVIEQVYDPGRLQVAWQQVRKNDGAAGIDNMSVKDFEERGKTLAPLIAKKLKSDNYRFKPAKRVYIEKEFSNKLRPLGIPVVMDRIVSQSMNLVLNEIFDKTFTNSNFGFRKERSQHMAIKYVQRLVKANYKWCAAIDLKSFFDEIPHNLIMKLLRRKIKDERFITLVARALKSGIIYEGKFEKTIKGCPQGSPISPILSNIVLNELDQELERRGLKYCRWADDFLIMVRSERAAKRILENITRFLEEDLGLTVNNEKSQAVHISKVTFLGFKIHREKIIISPKAREKFKDKVRKLTKRNNPLSMHEIIKQLNKYLQGWIGYFKIQETKTKLRRLDQFIRQRLRAMQLKKWKKPKRFQKMMIKAEAPIERAKRTWVKMNRWKSVKRLEVLFTLDLKWFRELGLLTLDDYRNATPEPTN